MNTIGQMLLKCTISENIFQQSMSFGWIILFGNPPCGWKPRISTSKCRNPGTIYEIGGVSLGAAAGHDLEAFKRAGGE